MPTPRAGYFLKNGDRVPGTTTIIGRFKDSGGLIQWAYKQGREHEGLARQGLPAPSRLYESVETAADIGTAAHGMVEAHINGDDVNAALDSFKLSAEARGTALSAYQSYKSWEEQSKLIIAEQELQMVSEEYRYGGTPDAVGMLGSGNELCLIDWKTSNGVYADMLIQLAAYKHLWDENHPDQPITGGFHLCRFAKTHGDFAHHYYPNLDEAWRQFILFREAYDIDKQLKKRV